MSIAEEPSAATEAVVELGSNECFELLASAPLARLAVSVGNLVDIFPITIVVDQKVLLFRTAPGSKLLTLTINANVAVEVDGFDDAYAWSVVVAGRAEELQLRGDIDAADALPLVPWIPTSKYRYVRVHPTRITGRRFRRGAEPDRD